MDAAQLELERGGEGARKRVRTKVLMDGSVGGDLLWAEEKDIVVVNGVVSPRKADEESSMARVGAVVPRKRTNANHLLTPKRGVKRTPLESLGGDLKGGLGAQIKRASPQKILLSEEVGGKEKLAGRRKSMRKSGVRRLTRTSFEEDIVTPLMDITADAGTASESVVTQEEAGQQIPIEIPADTTSSSNNTEQCGQLEGDAQETNLVVAENSSEAPELRVRSATISPVESEEGVVIIQDLPLSHQATDAIGDSNSIEESMGGDLLAVPDSTDQQSTTEAADIEEHANTTSTESEPFTSILEHKPTQLADSVLLTSPTTLPTVAEDGAAHVQPGSTPLAPGLISSTADEITSNLLDSPTKFPTTPRRGKKSATQSQSIRRSTRSKPASTLADSDVLSEIQPVGILLSPVKAIVEEQCVIEAPEGAELSESTPTCEGKRSLPTTEVEVTNEALVSVSYDSNPVELIRDVHPLEDASESKSVTNGDHQGTYIPLPSLCEALHQAEDSEHSVEADFDDNQAETHSDESAPDKSDEEDATRCFEATTLDSATSNDREDSEEAELEENGSVLSSSESLSEEETVTQDLEVTVLESDVCLEIPFSEADDDSLLLSNQLMGSMNESSPDDAGEEDLEEFEPVSIGTGSENLLDNAIMELDTLPESSTPDPSTTALVETISENAPSTKYDEDDTDLLRNFLTRVKANKEAKAQSTSGKRKRSLPHSPIQVPLESELSSPQPKSDFDVSVPAPSPAKRRKRGESSTTRDNMTEPQSIRRSGRTRLPIMTSSLPAPSFIPVRRLGQDGDNTITLRNSEDKDLAALTKINTRKNKGALSALDLLGKMGTQKEDPATRHQALKQKFDEKSHTSKSKKKSKKTVVWAEEIAQFQNADEKELDAEKVEIAVVVSKEKVKEKKKEIAVSIAAPVKVVKEKKSIPVRSTSAAAMSVGVGADEKKTPVKVGVRSSRITMGMVANGTPAPKRKVRGSARS